MPNIRYGVTKNGTVKTGLVLGSSSAPTTLYTFGTGLKGPDGQTGFGGILDRLTFIGSSSQAATRRIRAFLVSSSAPALTPQMSILDELLGIDGPGIYFDGPLRAADSYTIQAYIDAVANDVFGQVEVSEFY